jgi:hypothetical protein
MWVVNKWYKKQWDIIGSKMFKLNVIWEDIFNKKNYYWYFKIFMSLTIYNKNYINLIKTYHQIYQQ